MNFINILQPINLIEVLRGNFLQCFCVCVFLANLLRVYGINGIIKYNYLHFSKKSLELKIMLKQIVKNHYILDFKIHSYKR